MFSSLFILATMGVLSASALASIWLFMELITFLFIFLVSGGTLVPKGTMWKYFIIQALSSVWLIVGILWSKAIPEMSETYGYTCNWNSIFPVLIPTFLKLGMVPFHGWSFELVESLKSKDLFFFLTFSKIGPMLMFMLYMTGWEEDMIICVTLSSVLASFLAVKNVSLRQFLVLSSVVNMSWIFLCSVSSLNLGIMMMILYFFNVLAVLLIFDKGMHMGMKSFFKFPSPLTPMQMITLIFLMISLWGIPPMLMFMYKYWSLETLFYDMSQISCLMMLISSMVLLIPYLSMTVLCIMKGQSFPSDLKTSSYTFIIILFQVFIMFIICMFAFFM